MTTNNRPLFAWPGWSDFKVNALMAILFMSFFYIIYGFTAYAADLLPYKFIVGFEWEKQIPFIPETAFIYTSMNWMMIVAIFIVRDRYRLWSLLRVLCLQTLIGACIFLLFPVQNNFPVKTNDVNNLPFIYLYADLFNLKNNELPSLHICFAVTMAMVFSHDSNKLQSACFHIWALAIIISTFTMHEHNLLDIVAGYLLAIWGARYWYKTVKIGITDHQLPNLFKHI